MTQKKLINAILAGTYKFHPFGNDGKFFTPDFIRLINTKYDVEFMLYNYLKNTPFKDVDVNILREWKDYHNYMFYQFLINFDSECFTKMKQQNPAVWNQFCKQWEHDAIEWDKDFKKRHGKK